MTQLSPAAQAVLDAVDALYEEYIPEDGCIMATTLRAVADQVVPEARENHPATLDERHRKVSAFEVRNQLLSIADELENNA